MLRSNISRLGVGESEWRRLVFLVVGLAFVTMVATSQIVGAETPSVWRSDFKTALQEAEEKKLPLLIHFYADWCMPCKRMESEVFPNAAVKEILGTRFVAVKVNSDHRQDLIRRYGVETLPSDAIVDSLSGRLITLHAGYMDRSAYVSTVSQAEARFVKAHAGDLVVTKAVATGETAQTAIGIKSDKIELGEPKPVVGLDGFSPVALTKKREWNRGSPRFAWDYKDVTYHFSTREEMLEFRNNPEGFAPKLLGCDPVILWESDKAVAGDIRFGAYFDNELYLFKSEDRRRQFKSNPEKYIRLQHAVKVDQIERTVLR